MKCFCARITKSEVFADIVKSKLFWFGLVLKLVLAMLFASTFLTDLFLPFVNFYSENNFAVNPYDYFFSLEKSEVFPYPALMLWLVALPYYLALFLIKNSIILAPFLTILSLRISVLVADLAILLILSRWLKNKTSRVILFYWLSPVLIYISYIHGQLDCIPIAVLLLALYFLFKEKFVIASIVLAAAISCKTNIILAVPFFFIYLFSKKIGGKKLTFCLISLIAIFCLINAPYLASQGFSHMVLLNSKQSQIFDMYYPYHVDKLFYFVPAIYFILLIKAATIKGYNRDIFIVFLGFAFGALNLFIPPMQGWYYWVIPFLAYFFIKQNDAPKFLFFTLQLCYFAYFSIVKDSDYLQVFQIVAPEIAALPNLYQLLSNHGLNADKLLNLNFTILQVSLLLNCFWIYRSGITNYLKHKLVSKPYLIGISGDSGVGKSTFVSACVNIFGANNVTTLCGDDTHKWERGHDKWREFTHLNPSANRLHGEASFLEALKNGQKISRRIYDHSNGKFTEPKSIEAKKVVIFEGLHSLYVESVRKLFDVKIFIKPEKQLQIHWKIIRDHEKRGYSKEKVIELLKQRDEDSEKFILSQEKYADIKIELIPTDPIKNCGDQNEEIILALKISCNNNIDIEALIDAASVLSNLKIEHQFCHDDQQFIKICGEATQAEIRLCGDNLLGEYFDEINLQDPQWLDNLTGFVQLFIAYYVIQTELIK